MDLGLTLLGPVELRRAGQPIAAGGPTQRAVLAMLAARAGEPVGIHELIAGIWGEGDEPASGERSLWTHVSRLRRVLGDGAGQVLSTVPGGYRLDPSAIDVDAHAFEILLATARRRQAADDPGASAETLCRALELWRGPALMDLCDFPFASSVAARYEELHVGALEDWIEARLALGESVALTAELEELVSKHPYRERLHGQLMVALYRAGRQAAALDAYRRARARLLLDLGVEPGPELERLHREILQQSEVLKPKLEQDLEGRRRAAVVPTSGGLPAPRTLFGRDELLAELEQLAGPARLLTLTGPGGAGKTALGVALVQRLATRFRDGAAVVDLSVVVDADQVLPTIASAIGVSQRTESLHEQLAEYLGEHRLLLMLDNVEHVLEAVGALGPLIRDSKGLTIATSRSALGLEDEIAVDVPPLDVSAADDSLEQALARPAVQLFLHTASSAGGEVERSVEEIGSVGRLCAAVEGLPLAIQIVAAQTRAEAPAELLAHLDERLPRLRSRTRDAPARQVTMDAAVGWSLDRLPPDRREAASHLAVFMGSFTSRGAGTVLGLGREPTIDVLTDLLDASLLTRRPSIAGEARFAMLQPVRAVARGRLEPGQLADVLSRHTAFIADEVDRLCPRSIGIQRPADLAQLRALYPDLLAALRRLASAEPDRSMELADQLEDFWRWSGREVEARQLAQEVIRGGALSPRGAFFALADGSWGGFLLGQPDQLRTELDRMLAIAVELGDETVGALARLREAEVAVALGDRERGAAAGRAAVEHARRTGESRILALALASRALAELDDPDCEGWLREAIEVADRRSMGYASLVAMTCEGIAFECRGRSAEAIPVYRRAVDLARRYEAMACASLPAANLASLLLQDRAIDEARAVIVPALHMADRIGHRVWSAAAAVIVAEVEAATGRWRVALTLLTAARAAIDRMGIPGVWSPGEHARIDRMEQWLSELLGPDAGEEARIRGGAMSYREMVDLALDLAPVTGPALSHDGPTGSSA